MGGEAGVIGDKCVEADVVGGLKMAGDTDSAGAANAGEDVRSSNWFRTLGELTELLKRLLLSLREDWRS